MSHLRGAVWGPAEFVGLPPRRLTAHALLGGCATAGAVIGSAVVGTWYGTSWLADGEAGLACVGLFVLHLCVLRAGRALVGITAVLGVCVAFQAPQAAVGLVLAERGRVESAVVTSVEGDPGAVSGRGRYLCSVVDEDGVPLNVRIWRGCEQATRPGDAIAVVYDVNGRVPPRGVEAGSSLLAPLRDLAGWAAAFSVVYMVAVVRSYRLSAPAPAPGPGRVGGSGGWSSDGRAGGGRR